MSKADKHLPKLSVNLLETILQNAADGITVQDSTGKIVYANIAAAQLSGFNSVEAFITASSKNVIEKFHIKDALGNPFPPENFPGRRVLNGESYAEAVVRFHYPRKKREQWAVIKATPVYA